MPIVQPVNVVDPTSSGAYSVSDVGCAGDQYAISPAVYPVPGYLRMFENWRKAVRETIDTCALQQGVCWVIKRSDTFDRCGQRAGRGECEVAPGAPVSPGFAGVARQSSTRFRVGPRARAERSVQEIVRIGRQLNPDWRDADWGPAALEYRRSGRFLSGATALRNREPWAYNQYPDAVRRAVAQRWAEDGAVAGWKPLAQVTPEGLAPVVGNCVLPIWRAVWYLGDGTNRFVRGGNPMLYRAAVNAAMLLAAQQRKPRVIFGKTGSGSVIPVVYVDPGGIVRAYPRPRGSAVVSEPMTPHDVAQYEAASRGASIMPFGY